MAAQGQKSIRKMLYSMRPLSSRTLKSRSQSPGVNNLVPRVFSAFNMAAGLEKTTADHVIKIGQICKFFQNGGKESGCDNCQQNKMEYERGTQGCKI